MTAMMTILDELFSKAETDFATKPSINVICEITSNESGGFQSTTNQASVISALNLTYTPSGTFQNSIGITEAYPAKFSGTGLTIDGVAFPYAQNYVVHVDNKWFVPAFDNRSNVIYGTAGSIFVTISICSYSAESTAM
jgi:hypothetical protein